MSELAVVFQSGKGHTRVLAEAILKGIKSVPGANGRILEIRGLDVHQGRLANEASMTELAPRADRVGSSNPTLSASYSNHRMYAWAVAFLPEH